MGYQTDYDACADYRQAQSDKLMGRKPTKRKKPRAVPNRTPISISGIECRKLEDRAMREFPSDGREFFVVVYDVEYSSDNEIIDNAIAFEKKADAIRMAHALASGNMPRKVLKCSVVERVKSTDEAGLR